MYQYRQTDALTEWAVMAVIVVIFGAGVYWLNSYTCSSRWEGSGFKSSYGPIQGCKVRVDGRWLPEDRVREITPATGATK